MMYMSWDIWYFVLVLPAMLLGMIASASVKSTFEKYNKVFSQRGLTGAQAARHILNQNELIDVRVERIPGQLTDHFDPRENVIRLSDSTHDSVSVASIGVAAHEAGHAIQHAKSFFPNKIRASLVPVANIGSQAGPILVILGFFLNFTFLINLGIVLFMGAVLFYLITLPVEIDASRRAIKILEDTGTLSTDELKGAKKVLTAAAMTYIASFTLALANLIRFMMLSRRRND